MNLGEKPLDEMSLEEMRAAIELLRGGREELRNESLRRKAAAEAKGIREPKEPRERKKKEHSQEDLDFLRMLKGEI